jgi:hypothetical protein
MCYKPITNTAWFRARLCKLQKGCTRIAAASDKVYQLLAHGQPVVKSIYIQTPMNYFYSNRTHTVFEQPKQIMTLPIS